jgi:ring-1,2-phenylacetyl-CoA epoxidase subunit PaaD
MPQDTKIPAADIRNLLREVMDPEIPVIDIEALGVLRDVQYEGDRLVISITPTYSGCPAMRAIADEIGEVLRKHGITGFRIKTVLSPAWTTDWLSPETRDKLEAYGIAPPSGKAAEAGGIFPAARAPVTCPYCKSTDTRLTSAFGSTACKALHFCNACRQPFEEFKCH